MADTVAFELVSPERLLVSEPVEMVVVPGSEGDFGALPQHAPMLATVRPGLIDIYKDGKVTDRIFVAGGFAEVTGTRVTVLAEEAVKLEDLDPTLVGERLKQAEEKLSEADSDLARQAAERSVQVARAMQAAING